jgi:serine/threonine protein kinase
MGVVYKARQTSLGRLVALKMLYAGPDASLGELARFRNEAEAVARLQHPHIVQIYEVGEHDGRQHFSLELVEGDTLHQRLGGKPQPERPAARLVEVLARAIHFAHQRGIIHRDLKPSNILLAAAPPGETLAAEGGAVELANWYGVPKVVDFGLAKRLDDDRGQTRTGQILGTPNYMAPEQAEGKVKEAGPAADVYALGAILYEMLTGRPPFQGTTVLDTIWQVINLEAVPPGRLRPNLPRDLERVCLKCLEKDPRRRYASAAELADDLRRYRTGQVVQARPAAPQRRLWRWSRRNPVAASLLLAVTLGSAFGLWYLSNLSESLVRSAAVESAAQQSDTLDQLNKYHARVVSHLAPSGIKGSHDWEKNARAIPLPATMTIELGQEISARKGSGVEVRLYSDHPFRSRRKKGGHHMDQFERRALERLRQDPTRPYYRFEERGGRPALRYATARLMEPACVACHNRHPESTKRDWKVGEVRGVLEIIRPLDRDEARIREGLRGTWILIGGIGGALLAVSGLVFFLGNRRRRPPLSPV